MVAFIQFVLCTYVNEVYIQLCLTAMGNFSGRTLSTQELQLILKMLIYCTECREELCHKKVSYGVFISFPSPPVFSTHAVSYTSHSISSHHFTHGPNPPLRDQISGAV